MGIESYSESMESFFEAQDAEERNRDLSDEDDAFINEPGGQWEPEVAEANFKDQPRYTFDECSPIIDQIEREIFSYDFNAKIRPAGGEASKETALVYRGLFRNLDSISGSKFIYRNAAREMLTCGLSGWRLRTAWASDMSFDKDIITEAIVNYRDRVWLDVGSVKQDGSDAKEGWILTSMPRAEYDAEYPKGAGVSVQRNDTRLNYMGERIDDVVIGERLFIKHKRGVLARMSNQAVYLIDEDFRAVQDELMAAGLYIIETRETQIPEAYQQFFDGTDWLSDPVKTDFNCVPIVPLYGNFGVTKDRIRYRGEIRKLKDPQRVLNYSESRKVSETSLAPRQKLMMSKKQAVSRSVRAGLETMNTNSDPVQFYDHVDGVPPPFPIGGYTVNPALEQITIGMENRINRTSGKFEESRGQATKVRSGIAIERLQDQSKAGDSKYFTALEIALRRTQLIRLKAAPAVYKGRVVRTLDQDGAEKMVTLNERVLDRQTRTVRELNDLSKGQYDVTISIGPAYDSQQQETVSAITEIGAIDPSVIEIGGDVLLNNIPRPGMELIAARKRLQMLNAGLIPEEQLTDEERRTLAQRQQAQQDEPQSAMDQALLSQAAAEVEKAQANTAKIRSDIVVQNSRTEIERFKAETAARKQTADQLIKRQELIIKALVAEMDARNTEADTLGKIRQAIGADAIIGPGNTRAYERQVGKLLQSQNGINTGLPGL